LKELVNNVRWEKEEKFHFTLQFFGEQSEEWLMRISSEIQQTCRTTKKFTIALTKAGCFPDQKSPRIFWIGSESRENMELQSLAETIKIITQKNGLEPEKKPFHPHITVGRTKRKMNPNLIQKVETVTFHPIEFLCTEIHIVKSQLASTGSTYTTLFTIPLQ
jgi:RNA 2',3'-cyclic 3'-phosphodiesterase